ncbi:MFS transporter [Ancylobacter defluvii]|uniref:Fosmidomycin resistance protein n=1 Tax=Ancylobacter defluvii TaxID=1282440 RepID=A0A9W6JZT6_9HYPH|nr:MFS transporter [Ancylobacter defluvii]MBS7586871.1 MFS transporter [Ancylobacter defluvii]GLK86177.1 fosmidomycin resistance protein [Ancylobacter defluvii]
MSDIVADRSPQNRAAYLVLGAASFCHLLNDMLQSLFIAAYPMFKDTFDLNYAQIGLLTLVYNVTASLLQPLVGLYTDHRPQPYSLPFGMMMSLLGLLVLAFAGSFSVLLLGAVLLGIGSSIFHPESSRIARLASGGAHGLAQSTFQVGGNVGSALGPLLLVMFILPHGQASLAWFALAALGGIILLAGLGYWYKSNGHARRRTGPVIASARLGRGKVLGALAILICLLVSKWFYLASFTSFYVFYLMQHFGTSEEQAQLYLFVFLAAVAAGTLIGGPLGDRVGRKAIIWGSIFGVLPFSLVLPYVGLVATLVLSVAIGLILASAFSAIVVYAQDLMPGRVGMVSGLFFGLAFGLGGIGAAMLGVLADRTSIAFVFEACAYLPAIGILAAFLPNLGHRERSAAGAR